MGSLFQRIGDYIKRTDIYIWLLCISSTVISSILLSSVERAGGKFVTTQIMAAVIGIIAAIVISVIDYEYISRYWAALAGISMILFLSVFLFGITVEGTDDTAWLRLPGGLTFQPSELVKIFFIVTFSTHLHHLNKTDKLKTFPGVLGLLGHTLIPVAIIHFQGDDGSALIFMFMALIMMFVAGVQARYFITLITGLAIGIPVVWNFIMNNEHRNRILALADIWSYKRIPNRRRSCTRTGKRLHLLCCRRRVRIYRMRCDPFDPAVSHIQSFYERYQRQG